VSFNEGTNQFSPTNIQIGENWIHQSVHTITKNGKLHKNICRCYTYKQAEDKSFIEMGKGEKVGDKISSDVDKVVIIITDGVYKHREMIVYEKGND